MLTFTPRGGKMKAKLLKEKDIERQILIYLNSIADSFAFKVNTTGFYDTKIKAFRRNTNPFLLPGCSDVMCVYRGMFVSIEIKTPRTHKQMLGKSPTETQRRQLTFLECVSRAGGFGVVASSLDDVIYALEQVELLLNKT